MGIIHIRQNNNQEAFKNFSNALKGNHQEIGYYDLHAQTAKKLNKTDQAISSYEQVKKLNTYHKNVPFELGCCYYQKKDYKNAADNFELMYKKDPKNSNYAYNYAQSLLNLKEFAKAQPLFESCIQHTKKFPHAKAHSLRCLAEMKKIKTV